MTARPSRDTAPAARRRSRRGQGELLRAEILSAAKDLLAETGDQDAVSIRAISTRVGVSAPSIYLHFADKAELLDAVCDDVFRTLDRRMEEAADAASSPFDGLRRRGITYVRFALENPEHYRIVFMERPHRAHDHGEPSSESAFGHLVSAVRECIDVGVFDSAAFDPADGDAAAVLALGLWSATHGLASLMIAKPHFPWPPVESIIGRVVDMAGLGLAVQTRLTTVTSEEDLLRRLDLVRRLAPGSHDAPPLDGTRR